MVAQNEPDKIAGYYYLESKAKEFSQVQIIKSGDLYKGSIVWLQHPNFPSGEPKTDIQNKDKNKKNRPLIGLTIIEGLKYSKDKNRWEGNIYDPANGNTYKCVLNFDSDNILKLKGYIGSEWMGLNRTATWTKESSLRE
jgi:uncharacterized protein (DUF2147 family)